VAFSENYASSLSFYTIPLYRKKCLALNLTKFGLGFVLGDFFDIRSHPVTLSGNRPDREAHWPFEFERVQDQRLAAAVIELK
jgi:hypothetical protein